MAQLTPDEIAAEAAQRPRAGIVAIVAGVLGLLYLSERPRRRRHD